MGSPVENQSVPTSSSSAVPCCQRAWLPVTQVAVAKAKASVRGRACRGSSRRRRSRNIHPPAAAAMRLADSFSIMSPSQVSRS